MKKLLFYICCTLFCVSRLFSVTLQGRDTAENARAKDPDAFHEKSGFVDSLQTDSLRTELRKNFALIKPMKRVPGVKDPFDPFNHEQFKRIGVGKFWYFIIVVLALGVLVYYRRYFGKQFQLRLQSLIYNYYYRDLVSETSISFTTGSILSVVFSNLVLAQLLVLITIYLKFFSLNHIVYFIFIFALIIMWKLFIYGVQKFQAFILEKEHVLRNFTQRHINIDLVMAMVALPVLCVVYYNGNYFDRDSMLLLLSGLLAFWIAVRIGMELFGMFMDGDVSLTTMMYFCGLEMLPHGILLTALVRNYI